MVDGDAAVAPAADDAVGVVVLPTAVDDDVDAFGFVVDETVRFCICSVVCGGKKRRRFCYVP